VCKMLGSVDFFCFGKIMHHLKMTSLLDCYWPDASVGHTHNTDFRLKISRAPISALLYSDICTLLVASSSL
jgi:hypothetical protein